ncbi:hypothetical protein B0H34DRAFT_823322 [Crassisporium funariophilum]|nr:hypothetical protein B0H34DRAFT_823322 [Crassisporium funariophilum]
MFSCIPSCKSLKGYILEVVPKVAVNLVLLAGFTVLQPVVDHLAERMLTKTQPVSEPEPTGWEFSSSQCSWNDDVNSSSQVSEKNSNAFEGVSMAAAAATFACSLVLLGVSVSQSPPDPDKARFALETLFRSGQSVIKAAVRDCSVWTLNNVSTIIETFHAARLENLQSLRSHLVALGPKGFSDNGLFVRAVKLKHALVLRLFCFGLQSLATVAWISSWSSSLLACQKCGQSSCSSSPRFNKSVQASPGYIHVTALDMLPGVASSIMFPAQENVHGTVFASSAEKDVQVDIDDEGLAGITVYGSELETKINDIADNVMSDSDSNGFEDDLVARMKALVIGSVPTHDVILKNPALLDAAVTKDASARKARGVFPTVPSNKEQTTPIPKNISPPAPESIFEDPAIKRPSTPERDMHTFSLTPTAPAFVPRPYILSPVRSLPQTPARPSHWTPAPAVTVQISAPARRRRARRGPN